MDVIAIVAQKGGAGKTTLAVSLAVAAERSGSTVAIIDLDPQSSVSNWGDRREADSPVVVSAQPARLGYVLSAAKEQGADLLLIDTPPRAEQAAMAAARAADLILIPCRPSIYDLETVATTVELVRYAGNKPFAIVLTGVPTRGPKRKQATEVLKSADLPVCPMVFGYRAAFDHASSLGLNAQEYEPNGKAADEIKLVYKFIRELKNSSTKRGNYTNGKEIRRLTKSDAGRHPAGECDA